MGQAWLLYPSRETVYDPVLHEEFILSGYHIRFCAVERQRYTAEQAAREVRRRTTTAPGTKWRMGIQSSPPL